MSNALTEAIKEFIRTLLLGEIPAVIATLGAMKSGIDAELGTFVVEWTLVGAVFVSYTIVNVQTALVRALDKYIHKNGIKTPLDLTSLDSLKSA